MEWLAKLAPTVASALFGPLGGIAAEVVGGALGLSDKTVETVKTTLQSGQMTPEQLSALKQAEMEVKKMEQEQGFKFAELAVKNTQGARDMQVSVRSKVPAILATLVTFGFFGILIGMMTGRLNISEQQSLLIMLGALGTAWGSIINFYFGSSHGSQIKTEALANSQPVK